MYLPQCIYHFESERHSRRVMRTPAWKPLDLTVGCGQRLTIEPSATHAQRGPSVATSRWLTHAPSVVAATRRSTQLTLNGVPVQRFASTAASDFRRHFNLNLNMECIGKHPDRPPATDGSGCVSIDHDGRSL